MKLISKKPNKSQNFMLRLDLLVQIINFILMKVVITNNKQNNK